MNAKEARLYLFTALQNLYEPTEAYAIIDSLMTHITDEDPLQWRISEKSWNDAQIEMLYHAALELRKNKPLQYILEKAYCYNLELKVDENVLIPRPETEELIVKVLEYVGINYKEKNPSIIDIGTGSGCIALALRSKLPTAEIMAIDVSEKALTVARHNSRNLDLPLHFLWQDFLNEDSWKSLPSFDIIVSNPPYITPFEKEDMDKNVIAYEPHVALFVTDNDPLQFYKKIEKFAASHLLSKGAVFLELHQYFAEQTALYFEERNWKVKLFKDINDNYRMLEAHR